MAEESVSSMLAAVFQVQDSERYSREVTSGLGDLGLFFREESRECDDISVDILLSDSAAVASAVCSHVYGLNWKSKLRDLSDLSSRGNRGYSSQ